MAIPASGFNLSTVQSEFGSNTRTSLSAQSLRNFYIQAFGGAPSGSRLSDFGDTSQPTAPLSGFSVSANDNIITAGHNGLMSGNVTATLRAEIQSKFDSNNNELTEPDPNEWEELGQTTFTSQTEVNVSTSKSAGQYFVQIVVYNGFIEHPDDRIYSDVFEITASDPLPSQWGSPTINLCYSFDGFEISAEWNYDNQPSQFEARIWVNGNPRSVTFQSSSNWGTSDNPKVGTWSTDVFLDFGDFVEIEVRASAESGVLASPWSNTCSFNF